MTETLREAKRRRTRDAIVAHALSLFAEQGYDTVSVASIARAAEVGERTVYRYFPDKEEMLFAGDDEMRSALDTALAAQPDDLPAVTAVRRAARAVATTLEHPREELRRRASIIAATPALRARDGVKQAGYMQVIADELARRGLDPGSARLLGAVGVACFTEGLTRWLADHGHTSLDAAIDAAFHELTERFAADPEVRGCGS